MKPLVYNFKQKKEASTLLALASSEFEAAETLLLKTLFREAVVHMYFTSFYLSQALLLHHIKRSSSHKTVETQLHRYYGKRKDFPVRYVVLHSFLHNLRNSISYRATHTPSPSMLKRKFELLRFYLRLCLKVIPRLELYEIIKGIYSDNKILIKDFSYDIYCPKTYSHHNRITFWQPPFYLEIYNPQKLAHFAKSYLKALHIRKTEDYVVGLNSKLDQYSDIHLLMVDIDTLDPAVEDELKTIGGILLRTGRGFHFIGRKLIINRIEWERKLKKLIRNKILKNKLDKDHIYISLKRGYSTLRITTSPVKPQIPFFYKEI